MDSQYRISIPKNIRQITDVDLLKEVRIYLNEDTLLLSNDTELKLPCFGIVNFDDKFRFFVPKELRKHLGITHESKLLVCAIEKALTIMIL